MSLTSILNNEQGRSNLKKWFRHHFPNPGLDRKMEMIVPPTRQESFSSGEIGCALDYLIRFNLERVNSHVFKGSIWIAEHALSCILDMIDSTKGSRIWIGNSVRSRFDKEELRKLVTTGFARAKSDYYKFVVDGKLTTSLVRSSLFLARLDVTFRIGSIAKNIDSIDDLAVSELKALFRIVPWERFRATKYCVANPTFGEDSSLVGGADADLVIDDLLVDIKCSKKSGLDRRALNQILGYTFLSILEGVNGKRKPEIRRIGVYFARYGYLFTMPLSDFCDRRQLKILADEFKRLVVNRRLKLLPRSSLIRGR